MKPLKQSKLVSKLLLRHRSNNRLWLSLVALFAGTTLLLVAVMIWWNFSLILNGSASNDSLGSTFLTIGKQITNETMGKKNASLYTPREIEAVSAAPQVQDVGMLVSNRFPVYASLSIANGFATDMFLEAVPDRFMDNTPFGWVWEPGNTQIPIILSSDFLNLYNYGFALSQNLPQLSQSTIQALAFDLTIGRGIYTEHYTGRVVGFSDRISSVLVPQSFIEYGNKTFAPTTPIAPSRLILKVKDPSDKRFSDFLKKNNYTTNSEQLRWNKMRSVIEAVASGTGILAILLMGMGTLVFILFIELTIAKARQSLSLLLLMGYSPRYLAMFMLRRFVPLICVALGMAAIVAIAAQGIAAAQLLPMGLTLPNTPGIWVWAALLLSAGVLISFVSKAIFASLRGNE
ncbi:hypothetical protein CAP35_06780 [Chitinophagaceae bacterium IBVUCB1]|nr:hypothetical protein CAP35_06780 [Chitinophagaceae bacterium IBVUCB1]